MATDSDAANHVFSNNTVTNCGTFDPGEVSIRNCTFSNVTTAASLSAALIWNSNADVTDCSFINNAWSPSGAAGIVHTDSVSASVTYSNLQFSGNDYDILWLGTGTLTVQATNGANPTTYYAPNGGTVSIQNAINLTIHVVDTNGNDIRNATCYIEDTSKNVLMNEFSNSSGIATETYNYAGDKDIIAKVRKYGYKAYRSTGTILNQDLNITATMITDPQQT